MSFTQLATQIALVFCLMLFGVIIRRSGHLHQTTANDLTDMLLYYISPLVIIMPSGGLPAAISALFIASVFSGGQRGSRSSLSSRHDDRSGAEHGSRRCVWPPQAAGALSRGSGAGSRTRSQRRLRRPGS